MKTLCKQYKWNLLPWQINGQTYYAGRLAGIQGAFSLKKNSQSYTHKKFIPSIHEPETDRPSYRGGL